MNNCCTSKKESNQKPILNKRCGYDFIHLFRNKVNTQSELDAVDFALELIEDLAPTFYTEFAARGVHDAKEGGLVNHTFKVFSFAFDMIFKGGFYANIYKSIDINAFIIGSILHDVGKVMEYENGKNGKYYYVSHNLLGIDMISAKKDRIIRIYSEDTYYRILSIIGQHHGEFGENPQTVEAYLVHLADMLESRLQILDESLLGMTFENASDGLTERTLKSKYIPFKLDVGKLY